MMKFLLDSRLSWDRKEGKNALDYLEENFHELESNLDLLLSKQNSDHIFTSRVYQELTGKRSIIRKLSCAILKTVNAYQDDYKETAYKVFEKAINEIQNHLVLIELKDFRLFRVRPDVEKEKYCRKELFHVPFEKANIINAGRYSLSKKPCLYLGGSAYSNTGLSLCWFETNMPAQFHWSEFKIADNCV